MIEQQNTTNHSIHAADMTLWTTRQDAVEDGVVARLGTAVKTLPTHGELNGAPVVIGFACDEGVRRNQGRVGSADGPRSLRKALAPVTCDESFICFDAGDIVCRDQQLERAQFELSRMISAVLHRGGVATVLGGDHSLAWAGFKGLADYLYGSTGEKKRVDSALPQLDRAAKPVFGVLNIDAHLDMRSFSAGANSGTPFRQIAHWCEEAGVEFRYRVLGLNITANTHGLMQIAAGKGVKWITDVACQAANQPVWAPFIEEFISGLTHLQLSICLDGFSASVAPGVSAPNPCGIDAVVGVQILQTIRSACRRTGTHIPLIEIAELNPSFDQDGRTARFAARLISEGWFAR